MNIQYNFEWDINKSKINREKHKISFESSTAVFKDSRAISIYDDEHSESEDRWITIGLSEKGSLLVVHHTFQQIKNDSMNIRIFSCRKANKNETKQYMEIIK
jgi:uncharacterized protein